MDVGQPIKVNIKWGKKMLEGVEIDLSQDIMTFKCQVYSQTFVPVEKQKIMAKGKMIKEDMGLSDAQLGLLSGFSFALIYVTAGIPIAYWADRGNRKNIISLSLAVWSAMTALSGLAQSFAQRRSPCIEQRIAKEIKFL